MCFPADEYRHDHEYEYQLLLLSDQARIKAYREALSEIVSPGDVVADVGCGTGVLGRLALEYGAGKVFAVDHNPKNITLAQGLSALYCPDAWGRFAASGRVCGSP